jgi:hypothetical protein
LRLASALLFSLLPAAGLLAQVEGELPAPPIALQRGPLIELGAAPVAIPPVAEKRSWDVFRHSCSNPLGSRELTLFLDGTIRLLVRDQGGQEVRLGDLGEAGLSRTYATLRATQLGIGREGKDWTPPPSQGRGLSGEFLQECEVRLRLPDLEAKSFRFSPMEITPLWLGQLRQLAEDLAELTEPLVHQGLPKSYQPRYGDLLRRRDGVVFRYVGITSDRKAWIMEQVGQPITQYFAVADLGELFVTVVESRAHPLPETQRR